jgi:hypothetical protein
MRVPDLQPGTWAEWANAVATTLAFTVALVLLVIGLRDRRRANDDRRRDQARRVWVWSTGLSQKAWDREAGTMVTESVFWTIENTSVETITSCRVGLLKTASAQVAARPPVAMVVHGERSQAGSTAYGAAVLLEDSGPPAVQLIFLDAAGV